MTTRPQSEQAAARSVSSPTYQVSPGWKLFFVSVGLIFVTLGIFGIWYFGTGHQAHDHAGAVMMSAICGAFAALGTYCAFWSLRCQVTLHAHEIEVRGAFTNRVLRTDEVLGWRTRSTRNAPDILLLVPQPGCGRALQLSQAMRFDDHFYEWLNRFKNLDDLDASNSEEEILSNAELGDSTEERLKLLQRGENISQIFMIATFAICAWGWFIPQPYTGVIAILAAVPIMALIVLSRSRGLYRLDEAPNDAHPNFAVPLMAPGFILALRAATDFEFINWSRVGLISIGIGMILAIVAAASDSSLRAKRGALVALLFCSAAYGFGAGLEANALLDQSPSKSFSVAVLDKHIFRGRRSTTYNLDLAPWGPQDQQTNVSVSRRVYGGLRPGDRVCIKLHDGALAVPWYTVEMCQ